MGRWLVLGCGLLGLLFGCAGRSAREHGEDEAAGGENGAGGTLASAGTASSAGSAGELAVACTKNSDCAFAMTSCCRCNAFALEEVVALNRDHLASYADTVCSGVTSCPACTPTIATWLFAVCDAGRCTGVDVTRSEISACAGVEDCKIRDSRCCGCGDDSGSRLMPIRVDQDAAYESLACEPGTACAECAVPIPDAPDAYVGCFDGRCRIGTFVR